MKGEGCIFLLHVGWLLRGKALGIAGVVNPIGHVFLRMPFLLERTALDKRWLLKHEYLADVIYMNEVSLPLLMKTSGNICCQ